MVNKVYSKAEKRSWLNGLRLGLKRSGKKTVAKKKHVSELSRSQSEHQRSLDALKKKNYNNPLEYDQALVKINYHSAVIERQKKLGRVLTDAEKKAVYNDTVLTFF